MQDIGNDWQ